MKVVLGVKLYEVLDVAEMLSVSKTTIHNYVKKGKLDAQKIGGKLYCTEESIKTFISGTSKKEVNDY